MFPAARSVLSSTVFSMALACVAWAQVSVPDLIRMQVENSERRIREVRFDMTDRYGAKLREMRLGFQRAADLEGALAVRAEEQRLASGQDEGIEQRNFVNEPRPLRELQEQVFQKQSEMISVIIEEAVSKLAEAKKSLTIEGKLDAAVEVRSAIERLHNMSAPPARVSSGAQVSVEEVFQSYQTSKDRSDKTYKGVRVSLRGRVAGVRPDPKDPSLTNLVLFASGEGGLADCAFSPGAWRVKEDKTGQGVFYVVSPASGEAPVLRVQRGALVELEGRCEGWDNGLRFSNCALLKR